MWPQVFFFPHLSASRCYATLEKLCKLKLPDQTGAAVDLILWKAENKNWQTRVNLATI